MKKKKAPVAGAFTPYFLRNFRIEISGFVSDVQAGGFGWGKKPPGAGGFSPVKPPMDCLEKN